MPHHHHEEKQLLTSYNNHHDNEQIEADNHDHGQSKDDDDNIFSFAKLDEAFIPSQPGKTNIDLSILCLPPLISYQVNMLREQPKTHFSYYREFPPPGIFLTYLFSRPPPAC